MTGCVALRKDVYYVRLSYYDKDHIRKDKFVSTGLSGRGAKQKATAMIDSLIEKYSYLEKSDHPAKMADYCHRQFLIYCSAPIPFSVSHTDRYFHIWDCHPRPLQSSRTP